MKRKTRNNAQVTIRALENIATRREAEAFVQSILHGIVAREQRALVGFDFPYGYPRGFAKMLGALKNGDAPWRAAWSALHEHIEDDAKNANNRFAVASALNARCGDGPGPFWGCPPAQRTPHLHSTRKPAPAVWRTAEQRLHDQRKRPQESWKLLGAGSVGSQAMLGMPVVHRLRECAALADRSVVWPFEWTPSQEGDASQRPLVVHAEIWPGVVALDETLHDCRDAAQLLTMARWAAAADAAGELATMLDRPRSEQMHVMAEEGWILGVM